MKTLMRIYIKSIDIDDIFGKNNFNIYGNKKNNHNW